MKIYDINPLVKPESYYYQRRFAYYTQLRSVVFRLVEEGRYTMEEYNNFCQRVLYKDL